MKLTNDVEKSFTQMIDQWTLDGLRAGARDFKTLLRRLPGVYPTEVADSIHRLSTNSAISETAKEILPASESMKQRCGRVRVASELPIPHPLDYDWRFTSEAIDELLLNCSEQTDLACLGTPTVFVSALELFGPQRAVLLDTNAAVLTHLSESPKRPTMVHFDALSDPVPAITSDLVVADPPWYLEHMRAFLWVASRICRLGGRVLMSLPPLGTRPTVAEELDRVFDYAQRLGFSIKQLRDSCLAYETPPFESNALRAGGCCVLDPSWRRGTLCVFQRVSNTEVKRPRIPCRASRWLEAELYGTRFRFRHRSQDRGGFDDPTLSPLVVGDILPSVSRRHHLREHADIWSSGNRVFRCKGSYNLYKIVELLARGASPDAIPRSLGIPLTKLAARQVQLAAAQIEELASVERFERRFIGRG